MRTCPKSIVDGFAEIRTQTGSSLHVKTLAENEFESPEILSDSSQDDVRTLGLVTVLEPYLHRSQATKFRHSHSS